VGQLVGVSEQVADELATYYPGVPRQVISNGVDLEWFSYEEVRPQDPILHVVMVTGDYQLKGVDQALFALAGVEGVDLTVAGKGDAVPYLREAVNLGVADRVTFPGFLADLRGVYRRSDVVLCLSRYESFGLFLVEGALAGCALVSRRVGVAPELIGEDTGGSLVDGESAAVSAALRRFRDDRGACRRAGEVARDRASQFSVRHMTQGYLQLYTEMAASS
jgi:glycosyltransferase involved in cell wall biosynthesis